MSEEEWESLTVGVTCSFTVCTLDNTHLHTVNPDPSCSFMALLQPNCFKEECVFFVPEPRSQIVLPIYSLKENLIIPMNFVRRLYPIEWRPAVAL